MSLKWKPLKWLRIGLIIMIVLMGNFCKFLCTPNLQKLTSKILEMKLTFLTIIAL